MIFKASLDKKAKYVSIAITILFVLILFIPKRLGMNEPPIFVIIILFLGYGIAYALSPKSYELKDNTLIIQRNFKNISIDTNQIKAIYKLEKGDLNWAIKTFGVSGLFGYFGKFWNKKFGDMTLYATKTNGCVMLITDQNKKIVVTPDEIEDFMNEFAKTDYNQKK